MPCVNIYFTSCFGELLTSFLEQVVLIMMTWTRASLSCDTVFTQLIGSIYGRGMLMEECVRAMQQRLRAAPSIKEAYKERLFTAKSRDYQRSQEGIGRGERSRWRGNHHAHSPDAVRFLYADLGFQVLVRYLH